MNITFLSRLRRGQLAILATLVLTAVIANAQDNPVGSISGLVKDAGGAVIDGADVSLSTSQRVGLRKIKTDSQGRFQFDDIGAGSYSLVVSRTDFSTRREVVRVFAGKTSEVEVLLQVNQITEQVTVTSEAGLVAEARSVAQPVNVIDEEKIMDRATEVVAQAVDEEQGVNLQRTAPSLSAVFVRGMTGRNVGVYLDGVRYTTSAQRGGVGTFFSLIEPSSLEVIEILRGPNSSQYGSDVLGGVVNFLSHAPRYGASDSEWHGNTSLFY
jgi:hemoglobin/transferrin/lactoferrin receptor protein